MPRPTKSLDVLTKARLYDEWRAKQLKYRQSPEYKERQREYQRKYQQCPEIKAKKGEYQRKYKQRKALERARAKVARLEAALKKENE